MNTYERDSIKLKLIKWRIVFKNTADTKVRNTALVAIHMLEQKLATPHPPSEGNR